MSAVNEFSLSMALPCAQSRPLGRARSAELVEGRCLILIAASVSIISRRLETLTGRVKRDE